MGELKDFKIAVTCKSISFYTVDLGVSLLHQGSLVLNNVLGREELYILYVRGCFFCFENHLNAIIATGTDFLACQLR